MNTILRLPDVIKYVNISRATLLRMVDRKDFVQPIRLGPRCVGWRKDEVDAWIESRPSARAS